MGLVVVFGRIFIYARPAFTSQHWAVTVIVSNVHNTVTRAVRSLALLFS